MVDRLTLASFYNRTYGSAGRDYDAVNMHRHGYQEWHNWYILTLFMRDGKDEEYVLILYFKPTVPISMIAAFLPPVVLFGNFIRFNMVELRGNALLAAVTTLTSLGFFMIGYDNGLLGGLGMGQTLLSTSWITDDASRFKSMERHSIKPSIHPVPQSLA